MISVYRNVQKVIFGFGAVEKLTERTKGFSLLLVDKAHLKTGLVNRLSEMTSSFSIMFVNTLHEPTVEGIDQLVANIKFNYNNVQPDMIVGIGGGSTLDTAKAVSILLTNPGKAADYQGWDLVKNPPIYKIGIPTLSGTGSESSRTCVLTNKEKNLKLGINSDYSMFDEIILDPDLTKTVPREQFVHTMMDTYCHCWEYSLGRERDRLKDSLSGEVLYALSMAIWDDEDIMSDSRRETVMVASYLGGSMAGCTGLIHPFSAGLSMVLGMRHGLANCIAACSMDELFERERIDTLTIMKQVGVSLPDGVCRNLTAQQYDQLYEATIVHEKPLANALGPDWKEILTRERVRSIFEGM